MKTLDMPLDVVEALKAAEDRRRRVDCFFLALIEDLRRQGFTIEEDGDRWRALQKSVSFMAGEFLTFGDIQTYVVRDASGRVLNP